MMIYAGPLTLRQQQLRCVLEEVNATTSTLARTRDRLLMLSAALGEALDDLEAEQRARERG
jgi:hypothetical protein